MIKLISSEELRGADSERRYKLLEKLGISKDEALDVEGNVFDAACLILKKGLEKGLKKSDAISHITTYNIAALYDTEWINPHNITFKVSKDLSQRYDIQQFDFSFEHGKELPGIHFLREDASRSCITDHFESNVAKCNGNWKIDFSDYDLLRGIRFPLQIDALGTFVLGCYNLIGSFSVHNQFELGNSKRRSRFLSEILVPSIEETFNITPSLTYGPDRSYEKEYVTTSKGHRQFIEHHFPPYSEGKKYSVHSNLYKDKLFTIPEQERIQIYLAAYIASRGNVELENGKNIIKFMDKNTTILDTIDEIATKAGYKFKRNEYKNYLRVSPKQFQDLRNHEIDALKEYPIFNMQGMFVNPVHLDRMIE